MLHSTGVPASVGLGRRENRKPFQARSFAEAVVEAEEGFSGRVLLTPDESGSKLESICGVEGMRRDQATGSSPNIFGWANRVNIRENPAKPRPRHF